MTLNAVGLLLTAALAIVMYLEPGWSHRRRVRARLRALIATDCRRGRELPLGHESARRRLGTTASSAKITLNH